MDNPSLTASPPEMIEWCIKQKRPTQFFTSRIGIPQTEHSKGDRGRIDFDGNTASHCKALYHAWLQARKDMADAHFEWKDDLREKAVSEYKDLSSRYIGPLLDEYGPILWPGHRDVHVGRTISADYPRRLIHDRQPDRGRLTLYLYGWMLSCLIPKLPAHPDSVHHSRASGRASETTATFSHAPAPPASILGRGNIVTYESSESSRPIPHPFPAPSIPVAQMLLVRGVEQSNAQSPTSCAATETSQDAHKDNSGADADAATSKWDEYQPLAAPQRRIKHRGDWANAFSFSRNKRQKHSHHGTARSSVVVRTSNKSYSRTGYEEGVEEDEASSYPSPPDIEAEAPPGDTENVLNFPNIHRSSDSTADEPQWASGRATESDNITLRESGGARQSSSTNTNSAPVERPSLEEIITVDPNEDVDPITGEVEPPYTLTGHIERPPNASARPTLVVPIKLTPTTRDTNMLRKKLASKLADMRGAGLSNPNIPLLKSTVELLDTLSKASHLRLREIYQDTFNHYQGDLKQWLRLLNNIIIFYDTTGFKGNLSERNAFLEAMPEGCPVAVEDAFIHGSADLEEWLHNSGIDGATFAQEVASLLVHLGLWATWMNQDRIEKTTTQFTLNLLAWYGSS